MPIADDIPKLYAQYLTHGDIPSRSLGDRLFDLVVPYTLGYRADEMSLASRVFGKALSWLGPLSDGLSGRVMWLPASKRGRVLDIGCGNGNFLEHARRVGWQTVGLEVDPISSEIARRRGFEVISRLLEDATFPAESFDVVTMSHVIEHLPDPRRTLEECRRILKPGGWLVMATPNTGSLGHARFGRDWLGLDAPRHLIIFNPRAMTSLVERCGMKPRTIATKSRQAALVWLVGRRLRKQSTIPNLDVGFSMGTLPLAAAFQTWEYLRARRGDVGEELYVVAEK